MELNRVRLLTKYDLQINRNCRTALIRNVRQTNVKAPFADHRRRRLVLYGRRKRLRFVRRTAAAAAAAAAAVAAAEQCIRCRNTPAYPEAVNRWSRIDSSTKTRAYHSVAVH